MIALIIIAGAIFILSFFYGAFKIWRKRNPLYFQLMVAAVGCYALYQMFAVVMAYCNIQEINFNAGFFGLSGCYLFLVCANTGAFGNIFDKPKTKYLILSILSGVLMLGLSVFIGFHYFGLTVTSFLFIIQQVPACIVIYLIVKRLFTPNDELGLIKGLRLTDIFSILFCVASLLDQICWMHFGYLAGIADIILALIALGLVISAVRGAKKWKR